MRFGFKLSVPLIISMLSACGVKSSSKLDIIGGQQEPSDKFMKGSFPSTIGFSGLSSDATGSCTGSRLTRYTYITAAHCMDKSKVGEEIIVVASNSRKITAFIKKFQLHPTWTEIIDGGSSLGSDVALFELSFASREEKVVFDGLVETVSLGYGTFPEKDLPVVIAGFGCEQKTGFGPTAPCEKSPGFKYIKSARSKIYKSPLTILSTPAREFELDASSKKEGITGFTSSGDSGGPVFALDGRLIGITRGSLIPYYSGDDGWLGTTNHTWLEFPDVKTWLDQVIAAEDKTESFQVAAKTSVESLNGDLYIGAVENGYRSGQGVMKYKDGKIYQGNWLLNARSGYGEQIWAEGSKYLSYKGEWANDLPNGRGVLAFASGHIYSGQLVNAKYEGEGQLSYPNGDVRTGKFSNGLREGEFILVSADGKVYVETFKNDVRLTVTLKQ